MGEAFVFQDIFERDLEAYDLEAHQVGEEYTRIERAVAEVRKDLQLAAERIEDELETGMADVFRSHETMLRDVTLANEVREEVEKELVNAEYALQRVFRRWERKFHAMDRETFRQRGDDVVDLGRRLLRALAGIHAHSLETMPKGSILVARRLLPSDTTFFPRRLTAGIVVEVGGAGSHCALLTRQIGIPGVSEIPQLLDEISTGDLVLVDGLRGTVTVDPDEETKSRFRRQIEDHRASAATAKRHSHEPAVTEDGVTIPVMANISNRHDAALAAENGADGVGLYRIEMLFLARTMLPSEEELAHEIERTIAPLKGKPIFVRLLDIGGDKPLPYLKLASEPNPFLGRRGVRLLLHYPELLNVQLRALLRLSQDHNLQILVPLVTLSDDMRQVRAALLKTAAQLGVRKIPPLGAMIETPAAALCVDEIADVSDSLSIGTNDLTQYTMAAGRDSAFVYQYFKDDHPSIMKLLQYIGRVANRIPVGICGELAGRTEGVATLLAANMRMLSVSPPLVPSVKKAVRRAHAKAQHLNTVDDTP